MKGSGDESIHTLCFGRISCQCGNSFDVWDPIHSGAEFANLVMASEDKNSGRYFEAARKVKLGEKSQDEAK